ncbi:MAG: HAD family hydrolase [Thermoleophilia bacterium]
MAGLGSWNDGAARAAIEEFVARVTAEGGPDFVPPAERIAVFDNDGTLWSEQPMQVEIGFILQRLAEMAEADPALRDEQPWKAAHAKDHAWLGGAMTMHYEGDDSRMKVLMGGLVRAFAGWTVERYVAAAGDYIRGGTHPVLNRPFTAIGFVPMVELLRYLEAHGFTTYIASGGDRDFMRPVTEDMYGIPPERVIGSTNGIEWVEDEHGGSLVYLDEPDYFDDGPVKPVRIWSRVGRRPILAAGNANGDIPMLASAGGPGRPALRLVILHDDAEREFDYTSGADQALDRARADGWTVVSVRDDWATVFGD